MVEAVAVDVTADTAADARQIAIRRGEREALQILLRRMTLAEDHARLPNLDGATIQSLVRAMEFDNERYSSTRYIADLTISFDPEGVRRLLQLLRIPFAEAISGAILVLPIYREAGADLLWDRPNIWWEAWSQIDWRTSLLPFTLPEGTLADLAALSADQAMRGNRDHLSMLATRYGTTEVLVVAGQWSTDLQTGVPTFEVDVRQYGVAGERSTPFVVPIRADETDLEFLTRVASQIGSSLADEWKKNALVAGQGIQQTIEASLSLSSLQDLITAETRFRLAPMIRELTLESVSTTQAIYQMTFVGDQEQLSVSLAQYGIDLIETDEGWRLSLRR
ncbi:MAG: DUF2066 domain-containing protein [Alphaproteobacteria bacterium]